MVRGAIIGFAITLGCLLPPIIHLITGPLGPFIGGWFAGSHCHSKGWQSVFIGTMMGMFMIIPLALLTTLGSTKMPWLTLDWIEPDLLAIISIVLLLYTGLFGSLGALLGGYMVRSKSNQR